MNKNLVTLINQSENKINVVLENFNGSVNDVSKLKMVFVGFDFFYFWWWNCLFFIKFKIFHLKGIL